MKGVQTDIDLKGKRYGHWTLTGEYEYNTRGVKYVECVCDCGTKKFVGYPDLKRNKSNSCGCYRLKQIALKHTIHGDSEKGQHEGGKLYYTWKNMKSRCYNPHNKFNYRYGERGIVVCEEWKNSYPVFKAWALSNGYADDLSIDRIDNNGPYSPDNCRWVDAETQMNNISTNRIIEAFGEKRTVADWGRKYGIRLGTLYKRLYSGWDIETALTKPIQNHKRANI